MKFKNFMGEIQKYLSIWDKLYIYFPDEIEK